MKKVKFLALAMVFAIMLMGVGYAAWTDTITVNTTVATGNLDVDFTNAPQANRLDGVGALDLNTGFSSKINPLTAVLNENASDNGEISDVINVNAGNLYPGAKFEVLARVTNNGSIGAILGGLDITGADEALLDVMTVRLYYNEQEAGATNSAHAGFTELTNGAISIQDLSALTFPVAPGSIPLWDLGVETPLSPSDSDSVKLVFEFPFETPAAYAGNEGYLETTSATFNVNFNWVQFNTAEHTPASTPQ